MSMINSQETMRKLCTFRILFFCTMLLLLFGCIAGPGSTIEQPGYPPEKERSIYVYFADHDIGFHLVGTLYLMDLEIETEYFSRTAGGFPTFRGSGSIRFRGNVIRFRPKSIAVNGQELKDSRGDNFILWKNGTLEIGDPPFEKPMYR